MQNTTEYKKEDSNYFLQVSAEKKKLEVDKDRYQYFDWGANCYIFGIPPVVLFFTMANLSASNLLGAYSGLIKCIAALVIFFWIVRIYKIAEYKCRHPKLEEEYLRHAPASSDSSSDLSISARGGYERDQWVHTLKELENARAELRNLELRKASMSEDEYEKEKRHLEYMVNDWKEKADRQYEVYSRYR